MNQVVFFYTGLEPLLRIIIIGSLAYISLLFLLRVSGKRTLAQMNAFDFVITVAIGSTFGRLLTAKGVSLAESITAFGVLIGLQYIVSWLTVKSSGFADLVMATPTLLYFDGQFIEKAMRKQRLTKKNLLETVRQQGVVSLQNVEAIIMEPVGNITIIKKQKFEKSTDKSAFNNILDVDDFNSHQARG
ncbi:DUF421 domain-containing protein [Capilliphycus salinus ALCB114379]|uniref:DUF421 domain-containing protein n=1 Tax=Capilliphycus salinus TaxID=2768948 RepID=UPI0039A4D2F5